MEKASRVLEPTALLVMGMNAQSLPSLIYTAYRRVTLAS